MTRIDPVRELIEGSLGQEGGGPVVGEPAGPVDPLPEVGEPTARMLNQKRGGGGFVHMDGFRLSRGGRLLCPLAEPGQKIQLVSDVIIRLPAQAIHLQPEPAEDAADLDRWLFEQKALGAQVTGFIRGGERLSGPDEQPVEIFDESGDQGRMPAFLKATHEIQPPAGPRISGRKRPVVEKSALEERRQRLSAGAFQKNTAEEFQGKPEARPRAAMPGPPPRGLAVVVQRNFPRLSKARARGAGIKKPASDDLGQDGAGGRRP